MKFEPFFTAEEYSNCIGCITAIWPGDQVAHRPFDFPPHYEMYPTGVELVCKRCVEHALSVTHNVHCVPCLNPYRTKTEHADMCPLNPYTQEAL